MHEREGLLPWQISFLVCFLPHNAEMHYKFNQNKEIHVTSLLRHQDVLDNNVILACDSLCFYWNKQMLYWPCDPAKDKHW